MNSALNMALPIVEMHGDSVVKRKIKEVLFKKHTDAEMQSDKESPKEAKELCKKMKEKLLNMDMKILEARNELAHLKGENECFRRYISYSKKDKQQETPSIIPTFVKTIVSVINH
eukprot:TRINITY_DN8924_c0_g4_i1.p4 TRINITY_DN8924_c0_g4~~TRINITY_DN8924_c0_g4_i1.p4  ORF type:complete len:115 (-),score=34.38 TRINITY_DN8924_c0_g4_i1:93-437(-)